MPIQKITSGIIQDGAIVAADIVSIANTQITGNIVSSQITSVANTQITGNITATTTTNLAGGSNGTIPYQSASGTTQMLAVGTSGQLLQTNGAGAPSWVTASAGALTLLSTVTASASATVDMETTFNSTYDRYLIEAVGVTTSSSGIQFLARLKIGGSYISSTTYYGHSSSMSSDGATYSNAVAFRPDGGDTALVVLPNSGNEASDSLDFTMTISNPTSTAFAKSAYWIGRSNGATSTSRTTIGAGHNSGTAALTGVRFLAQTGTFSGKFRLYGIANS